MRQTVIAGATTTRADTAKIFASGSIGRLFEIEEYRFPND